MIRDILEGVLRLMGIKDTSWVSMKTFLSRKGITDIMNFDCRSITSDVLVKVEALLNSRPASFQSANARRASVAAASLAEWVKANVEYAKVLHKIDPLERELSRLESGLVKAQSRLKTLNLQLQGVDTEVEALRTRMQTVTIEAAQIEINLEKSSKVLEQSELLVSDLSGEHHRWAQKLSQIEQDKTQLPVKCLLTAAYICLSSTEPSVDRRQTLLKQCIKQYLSTADTLSIDMNSLSDFNPIEFMNEYTNEEEMLIKSATTQPISLICDPAHKVVDTCFIDHISNNLTCEQTRFSSKDWLKVLELSIRFGQTLLITDFSLDDGSLDIRLVPLLFGEIYGSRQTRYWTFIGDRKIDYNPKFKLYLLSYSNNASSNQLNNSPTTATISTMSSLFRFINLSPSFGSISSQLLRLIISIKKPELERQQKTLESEVRSLRSQLTKLENELLENLNSSQCDQILENVQLMEKLRFLKKSSQKIEESLQESDKLQQDLERERQQYKNVAEFGANLFFSIGNLERLCSMYCFGYQEFEEVFRQTLERFAKDQPLTNDIICYVSYVMKFIIFIFILYYILYYLFFVILYLKDSLSLYITSFIC